MGLLSGLKNTDWDNVATRLAVASAFGQGDFTSGAGLLAYGAKAKAARSEAEREEEERRRLRESLKQQGLTDQQADLVLGNAANIGDFRDKPNVSPMERDLGVWQGWTPEQRDDYIQMQDVRNPQQQFIPDGMGGGRFINVPRAGNTPARPVGKLTPITPAPGAANEFTQEQYRGLVSSLGQQGADEYLRRNGMRVRGY